MRRQCLVGVSHAYGALASAGELSQHFGAPTSHEARDSPTKVSAPFVSSAEQIYLCIKIRAGSRVRWAGCFLLGAPETTNPIIGKQTIGENRK